ncbi:iron-hydroxamate ABC transporter substrate-binding protein [Paenibacillus sp. MBLB4367]|uniref:iron-hydroxamate ABC transporter substrate-binding protein n=1 Tax=Paenibacillus sp. MBLB4367 TaxID=3384767 RepID=UPI0039080815
MLAIVSACGSAAVDQKGTSPSAAPSDSGGTVAYKAANGEVQMPKNPKRIVVLADSYVGDFLALGIKPVGVSSTALENPYFKGKTDGIESIGDTKSVEKILELKPDLIITFNGIDYLDQLAKVAPTVAIDYGKKTFKEQLLEFGKITNRVDQANAWIASWDKKIAEAKPKVEAAVGSKTVSILNPYAKGIYAFGHNYGRGGEIIYGEFQLKAPQMVQKEAIDSGKGWANLSLESLPDFAGDIIFTCPWSGDTSDPEVVYGNSIWKGLPAVANKRVYQLEPKGAYYNDPVSLEAQLAFIVEKLTQG